MGDYYTLHPTRYSVLVDNSDLAKQYYIKNYSVIGDGASLYHEQREYLNQDLVEMYNSYRFAFVGSECSGIAALGTFEAMACGCEVFLEKDIAQHLGLVDGVHVWTFDNVSSSLLKKLVYVLDSGLSLSPEKISDVVQAYRSSNLSISLKESLNICS